MTLRDVIRGKKSWDIVNGNVIDQLKLLPDNSVHCCVTSPPYWGLRAYGTDLQVWGGDKSCEHEWTDAPYNPKKDGGRDFVMPVGKWVDHAGAVYSVQTQHCHKCGAWLGELGSEPTMQQFVANLVEIFREIRRVMHPTGVCFVNIGDSYAGSGRGPTGKTGIGDQAKRQGFIGGNVLGEKPRSSRQAGNFNGANLVDSAQHRALASPGLKPKDMCLIPERLAIALQDDGWWIRSKIAWIKPSGMPESVSDRPANTWEPIWMLSKQPRYFYDDVAVQDAANSTLRNYWELSDSDSWKIPSQHFQSEFCFGCETLFEKELRHQIANACHECGFVMRRNPPRVRDFDGSVRTPCRECGAEDVIWDRLCPNCKTTDQWVSHFAAFPTRLVEIAIKAGSSEKGVCPICYAPWVRWTDRSYEAVQAVNGFSTKNLKVIQMRGWQPSCEHGMFKPTKSVVLDPFSGTGTTVLVAKRLGRAGTGIELNQKYHKFSIQRVMADSPLFDESRAMVTAAQTTLWSTEDDK